jgi:DNA (cytosine-5)-methyltransferase 1
MGTDLTQRDPAAVRRIDLYVVGLPCQPFSNAGLMLGFADERWQLFEDVERLLDEQQPSAFLIENTSHIVHQVTLSEWLIRLQAVAGSAYNVSWSVVKTHDHGVPQKRHRVYIVGIRKYVDRGSFSFPTSIACQPLESLLGPEYGTELPTGARGCCMPARTPQTLG